eukprot:GILK01003220.1.p1 GENE.GILK01003220.1~~GILK01003220.1.p1  ORF type:complete len:246 (+),score=48.85 GILK01003220.1:46-738(+)
MADGSPVYGLDKDLAERARNKHDPERESKALQWIYDVTEETPSGEPLADVLKDGVLLCKLINKIKEGHISRINSLKSPFKMMENITAYIQSCRDFGVREMDLFSTVDLYEAKNIPQVVQNLYSLARAIESSFPEYMGPRLEWASRRSTTDGSISPAKRFSGTYQLPAALRREGVATSSPSSNRSSMSAQTPTAEVTALKASVEEKDALIAELKRQVESLQQEVASLRLQH